LWFYVKENSLSQKIRQLWHCLTDPRVTKKLLLKTKEKKTLPTGQSPGKTMTEILLKYQYQDWMLEE
jgi:hypothetical protein